MISSLVFGQSVSKLESKIIIERRYTAINYSLFTLRAIRGDFKLATGIPILEQD